jgi:hypothetical protein
MFGLPVFPRDFLGAQALTSAEDQRRSLQSLRGRLCAPLHVSARQLLRWLREWIRAVGVSFRARSMMFLHRTGSGHGRQYAMSSDPRSTTPSLITIVRGLVRTITVWRLKDDDGRTYDFPE